MYTLSNTDLQVEVLDPLADQARFGPRYCTGGYIFQITDARHGPLLTGPTYPADFNWFDGQGLPDAFNLAPLRDPATGGTTALIIGIGVCELRSSQAQEFCGWEIAQAPAAIRMLTMQVFQGFALELERTVSLSARTVRSTTRLKNTGSRAFPLCWFPHPFFPQPDTPELCRFNIAVRMPDNPGYAIAESGFIARKAWPSQQGYYQALDHAAQTNLVVLQRHPMLGLVAATCSYVPSFFPIWGNQHTFSWEPFLERTLAIGQELTWWIDYDF
ncbi:MAG: hypothetical protein ACJ8CR_00035 [Roseiflexaceae bacterium]